MKRAKSKSKNDILVVLMIICVLLSLVTLGIVAYDKYVKTDCNCNGQISCNK